MDFLWVFSGALSIFLKKVLPVYVGSIILNIATKHFNEIWLLRGKRGTQGIQMKFGSCGARAANMAFG